MHLGSKTVPIYYFGADPIVPVFSVRKSDKSEKTNSRCQCLRKTERHVVFAWKGTGVLFTRSLDAEIEEFNAFDHPITDRPGFLVS